MITSHFGIPVVLVTGDQEACDECNTLIGKVGVVSTKVGASCVSAICTPLVQTLVDIKEKAKAALVNLEKFFPYKFGSPFIFELELTDPSLVLWSQNFPGVEIRGDSKISFEVSDFLSAYRNFIALTFLLLSGKDMSVH